MTEEKKEDALNCPCCGKPLTEGEKFWNCECGFRAYRIMGGTEIYPDELRRIFAGQGSELSFTSKAGNPYKAQLRLSSDKKRVEFDFHEKDTGLNCPKCGKPLLEDDRTFSCEAGDFKIWKNHSGHFITRDELAAILDGKCGELSFTSKAGKPYKGRLVLDENKEKLRVEFDDKDKKKEGEKK